MCSWLHKSMAMTVRFTPKIQSKENSRESKQIQRSNVGKQNKPFVQLVSFISMEVDEEKKALSASPTSSPPTPPSPLPISVGPGNRKYLFSPSPSPSPPFSPPPSSHTSAENLPLLPPVKLLSPKEPPSAFSLDHSRPAEDNLDSKSSCLTDLLEWFIERCFNCCTKTPNQLENRSSSSAAAAAAHQL